MLGYVMFWIGFVVLGYIGIKLWLEERTEAWNDGFDSGFEAGQQLLKLEILENEVTLKVNEDIGE